MSTGRAMSSLKAGYLVEMSPLRIPFQRPLTVQIVTHVRAQGLVAL